MNGRLLMVLGATLVALGGALMLAGLLWSKLGRLPLDLRFERGNTRVYVPLGTALLVSLVATLLLNLWLRLRR